MDFILHPHSNSMKWVLNDPRLQIRRHNNTVIRPVTQLGSDGTGLPLRESGSGIQPRPLSCPPEVTGGSVLSCAQSGGHCGEAAVCHQAQPRLSQPHAAHSWPHGLPLLVTHEPNRRCMSSQDLGAHTRPGSFLLGHCLQGMAG